LCLRRRFRVRRNSAPVFRLTATPCMLARWVGRRRICPRGNNVLNAATAGTTGEQRGENQYCSKAHDHEASN
jgi:hypothetical protein